jgi:hypothetical protein
MTNAFRVKLFACAGAALVACACTSQGDDDGGNLPTGAMGGPALGAGTNGSAPPLGGVPATAGVPGGPITTGGAGGTAITGGSGGTGTVGSGGSTAAGTSGSAAVPTAGTDAPPVTMDETKGCGTTTLLPNPTDTSKRGPWPVGARTVKFGRFDAVEIMYPATPGSEAGMSELTYDLRDWLPASERAKIPDAQAKQVGAGTFRDLPLDATHGPYPVVILVHGTGAFRVASAPTQAHWASRGFVVVAAEHPNLYLTDMIEAGCGSLGEPALDLEGDVDSEIETLASAAGPVAFLKDHIDMTRIGLAGHSAGAFAVAQFGSKPGVQVIIPLAGTHAVLPSSTVKSSMYVSGFDDTVLPYEVGAGIGSLLYPGTSVDAYNESPGPPTAKKRLVAIAGGGHLAVTDLCQDNALGDNPMEVAQNNGVCGLGLLPSLFDCGTVERVAGLGVVNDASAAALEETLHCHDRTAVISAIKDRHTGLVADLREAK